MIIAGQPAGRGQQHGHHGKFQPAGYFHKGTNHDASFLHAVSMTAGQRDAGSAQPVLSQNRMPVWKQLFSVWTWRTQITLASCHACDGSKQSVSGSRAFTRSTVPRGRQQKDEKHRPFLL